MLPTRISVCTAPGLSITTTRRVDGGGSGARGAVFGAVSHDPKARSAPANASSAVTSPTMARIALFAPYQALWNPRRSWREMLAIEDGVPELGRPYGCGP